MCGKQLSTVAGADADWENIVRNVAVSDRIFMDLTHSSKELLEIPLAGFSLFPKK